MPSTATMAAIPIAMPSADSAARSRRVRRPSAPVRRTSAGATRLDAKAAAVTARPSPPGESADAEGAGGPEVGRPGEATTSSRGVPESDSTRPSRSAIRPGNARRDLALVGDHEDRRALPVQLVQQREDPLAGAAVEVAGRLVGEHDRRAAEQRPRDRHALALAARQRGRHLIGAVAEADPFERRLGAARRSAAPTPAYSSPVATLSSALIPSSRKNCWNTKADPVRPQGGEVAVAQRARVVAPRPARRRRTGARACPSRAAASTCPTRRVPTTATSSPVRHRERHAAQRLDATGYGLAYVHQLQHGGHCAVTTFMPSRQARRPTTSTQSSA
jgi:hypothetical protein